MSEQSLEQSFEEIIAHAEHGGKQAVVDEASELLIDLFQEVVGEEMAQEFLEKDGGREVAKLVTGLGVFYASDAFSFVPKTQEVKKVCGLVIQNGTRNLIGPRVAKVKESMLDLADLAQDLNQVSE